MSTGITVTGDGLNALLHQLEAERKRIDDDIAKVKAALEVQSRLTLSPSQANYFPAPTVSKPEGFTESIRAVIKKMPLGTEFSIREIDIALDLYGFPAPKVDLRTRIAMVLQKLLKRGEIVITAKGAGRIPNRYKAAQK